MAWFQRAGWMGIGAVAAGVAVPAEAVTRTWVGPVNGTWGNDTHWSPIGIPTAADDVLFNSGNSETVNIIFSDKFANSVAVTNGDVLWRNSQVSPPDDPLVDITGSLVVGGFGTSPSLTINARDISVDADTVSIGSGFGGVAELFLEGSGVVTANTVSIGTGSSQGVLRVSGNSFTDVGNLLTDDLTIGGGVSGQIINSNLENAFAVIDVNNHLQVNATGTIELHGQISAGTATILGQLDRPNESGARVFLEVANQLTWNTTDGLITRETARAGTVDLQSNLALAGGILEASGFTGPGVVNWTSGTLGDPDDLTIDGANANLPATLSISSSKELYVGGELNVGADQGGDLVHTASEEIASQTGSLGSDANADGIGASAIFGTVGGGWHTGGDLVVADDTSAALTIQSGAVVITGVTYNSVPEFGFSITGSPDADIVLGGSATGTHVVSVDGAMSQLWAADDVFIGGTKTIAAGNATVTLTNAGELIAGDTITVWNGAELDARGGIATFQTLDVRGTADFRTQTITPDAGGYVVALNGGTLRADAVDFGNLPLIGFGTVDAPFSTQGDVTATGDLTLGDASDFNGVSIGGTLNVGSNTVTLNKAGFFTLGNANVNTVAGSRVIASNGFQLPAGAVFSGSGNLQGRIASSTGSIILAQDSLALGDALNPAGVFLDGELDVATATVTLNDANDAVLGSLTTLGDGLGNTGVLIAQNGITLGFGRNLAGHGTVLTPNDPFKPLINNGNILGESAANPITLTGYVKGVGTLDHVTITGTDAPGFSPATVYRGNVAYAGTLEIELGGTSAGTFDRIVHSGVADLGGTLDVALINEFNPALGDSFAVLSAAQAQGTFDTLSGLDLGGGLSLDVVYSPTAVSLLVVSAALVGDYNADGFVSQADLDLVLLNWGATLRPVGFNEAALVGGGPFDGLVSQNELDGVLLNWGNGTPPTNSIPEPGGFAALVGLGSLVLRRRR